MHIVEPVRMSTYTAREPHAYIEAVVEVELTGSEAGSEDCKSNVRCERKIRSENEAHRVRVCADLDIDGLS
jgi:hypothetical protein